MQSDSQVLLWVAESGLPTVQQDILVTQFADFFTHVALWSGKAQALNVTSEDQVQEMKQAREGRIFLKNLRSKVENTRKDLKEESLKQGRAIDLIATRLKGAIEPIEAHLQEQETFAVRAAAQRKENLRAERHEALQPYTSNPEFYPLGEMEGAAFDELLAGLKLGHEKKEEEARLAWAEIQATEAAAAKRLREQQEEARQQQVRDAEAAEAQRQENERLRAEAAEANRLRAEAEAQARREREAAEAKQRETEAEARREREAAEQLRRQAAEQRAAEERAQQARAEEAAAAQRRAAAAPDREKLLALIEALNAVALPELATPEAQKITADVQCLLAKVNAHIRSKAEQL